MASSKQELSFDQRYEQCCLELTVGKSLFNSHGKFKFRNSSAILEAIKPLIIKHKLSVHCTTSLVEIGNHVFLKATTTVFDMESDANLQFDGFAKIADSLAGMSAPQVTGACTSYALKYSLGLAFKIDDSTDDPDTLPGDNTTASQSTAASNAVTKTTAQAPTATAPATDLPWLNEGTVQFDAMQKAVRENVMTIADVRKQFKLSKKVAEKLSEIPAINISASDDAFPF